MNMIDFIIIRRRERVEVRDCRSLVSADCDSDHHMVWIVMKGKAWKPTRQKKNPKRDLHVLNETHTINMFEEKLKSKLEGDQTWTALKQGLMETIEEVCPKKSPATKPWIDNECWRLIQKRKEERKKNPNGESHQTAAKRAKKALRIAKKKWFTDLLKETEEAQGRGDYKTLYDNIIKVSRKKTTKPGIGIKDQDGTMLYKIEDIKKRWKNYCSELFGRVGHTPENIEKGEEPEILEIEIEAAVKKLKKRKVSQIG